MVTAPNRIIIPLSKAHYAHERTIYKIGFGRARNASSCITANEGDEADDSNLCMAADKYASRRARLVLKPADEHGVAEVYGVSVLRCHHPPVDATTEASTPRFCIMHAETGSEYRTKISLLVWKLVSTRPLMIQVGRRGRVESVVSEGFRIPQVARFRVRRLVDGNWEAARSRTHDVPLVPEPSRRALAASRAAISAETDRPPQPSISHFAMIAMSFQNDYLRAQYAELAERYNAFEPIVQVNGAILIDDVLHGRDEDGTLSEPRRVQMCGCCETVPANAVAAACGHLYACMRCARSLEGRCPICRRDSPFIELRCATA